MRTCILLWIAVAAWCQPPGLTAIEQQRAAIEQQRANLEPQQAALTQQKDAVRRQIPEQATPGHAFFTTNWGSEPMIAPTEAAPSCDPVAREQLDTMIKSNAEKNGLNPDLLRSLIRQESAFYPCAISSKGAMGLMQLMPGTAWEMNVINPLDPADNVRAGTQYLRQLLDRYNGDLVLALSAYNAGPARVDAAGGIPQIKETQQYVRKILGDTR